MWAAGAARTGGWEPVRSYDALIEIATQIHAEEFDASAVLALIVERARDLLATDVAWLALVKDGQVRVQVAAGAATPGIARMEVALGTGIGGIALREGRTVVVGDQALYGHGMPSAVHDALEADGIVSVMCAPMLRERAMVGALYVGSREAAMFDDAAVALLTALAGQAAIAIVNSRLYQALADKHRTLERSFAAHRRLNAASSGGPDAVAAELARQIGREVTVSRGGGEPLEVKGPLSELERNALDHAATVIALLLEAEWRVRGDLLEELLRADGDLSDGLSARAERLGVTLDRERCVAVLEGAPALRLGLGALMCRRGDRVILALEGDAEATVRAALGDGIAGLSSPRRDLTAALREAEAALRLAREYGGLVSHEQLGPLRFLLDAPHVTQSETLVREALAPLAAYDAQRDSALVATLGEYLRAGGHHATTAERLHIHPSTLKYRLARIAEVLGRPPADPQARFELGLAVAVHEMLLGRGINALRPRPCRPTAPRGAG
jgi:putative methionine-R-sulfoxide reductase with GAF domain